MVAIFDAGTRQAYGMLSDLSLGGARIVSETEIEADRDVLLRIRFDDDSVPFSTPAAITWVKDDSDVQNRRSFVYGVRFMFGDEAQELHLKSILESRSFARLVVPGHIPSSANGLDGKGSEAPQGDSSGDQAASAERRQNTRLKIQS